MPGVIISPIHVRLLVFNALRAAQRFDAGEAAAQMVFGTNVRDRRAREGAAADNGTLRAKYKPPHAIPPVRILRLTRQWRENNHIRASISDLCTRDHFPSNSTLWRNGHAATSSASAQDMSIDASPLAVGSNTRCGGPGDAQTDWRVEDLARSRQAFAGSACHLGGHRWLLPRSLHPSLHAPPSSAPAPG